MKDVSIKTAQMRVHISHLHMYVCVRVFFNELAIFLEGLHDDLHLRSCRIIMGTYTRIYMPNGRSDVVFQYFNDGKKWVYDITWGIYITRL